MKKLTICFYEFPQASHLIEDWSNTAEIVEKTLSIEKLDAHNIIYNFEDEVVFCTPIFNPHMKFVKNVLLPDCIYHKTLIFGKINSIDLRFVEDITRRLENGTY